MKRRRTALVLSGGGNRGALQVGALRALFERGFRADMLVGVSAGALNSALLATLPGSPSAVGRLAQVWSQVTAEDVYPGGRMAMLLRALSGAPSLFPNDRFVDFLQRILPVGKPRFGDLSGPELYVVASRMETGALHVFGNNPDDRILDALMASTAVPPLHPPWKLNDKWLIDGGMTSTLPISVALDHGADEAWGIYVTARQNAWVRPQDVFSNASRALITMLTLQAEGEIQRLRKSDGRLITVSGFEEVAPWDFSQTAEMISEGYRQASQQLGDRPWKRRVKWSDLRRAVERLVPGQRPRASNGSGLLVREAA